MAAQRAKGTVKSINEPDAGFGIISSADDSKDYSVRLSDVKTDGHGMVNEGQRVEFTAAAGDDGKPVALDVTVLGGAPDGGDRKVAK